MGEPTAKASLSAAEQQLRVAQADREKVRTMFAYAQIKAPFAGVVTKRYADTGSMIQTGISSQTQSMPLVTLAQVNLLRLVIPVPESAVSKIRLGSPVEVRISTLGKKIQGKVARFADQVDTATRTMHTEVDVPNPTGELVPGMYASASLVLNDERNALAGEEAPELAGARQLPAKSSRQTRARHDSNRGSAPASAEVHRGAPFI